MKPKIKSTFKIVSQEREKIFTYELNLESIREDLDFNFNNDEQCLINDLALHETTEILEASALFILALGGTLTTLLSGIAVNSNDTKALLYNKFLEMFIRVLSLKHYKE